MKKFSEFVEEANKKHDNKYDYSRSKYINTRIKICIICPVHGEFWQSPNSHLMGHGCSRCHYDKISKTMVKTTKKFVEEANKIHNDKYNYSKTKYIDYKTKVCIICPVHGEFWQRPEYHLIRGCRSCSLRLTTEQFIEKAKLIHKNKYNYSKTKYMEAHSGVCIICPEHGEFLQKANDHLNGNGCPECNGGVRDTIDSFIKKAEKIHGNKYDYSKIKYINSKTKVSIVCPEHNEFWQKPSDHLTGCGCPICKDSKGEKLISFLLKERNILFEKQKTFGECRNPKTNSLLMFDFYLSKSKTLIEFDGVQHYETSSYYWTEDLEDRDKEKNNFCKKNNLELIRIPYWYKKEKIERMIGEIG